MDELKELIGRKVYYPISQIVRIEKRGKRARKEMIVAWVQCKVVAAKREYGRTNLVLQPKGGAGSIAAQLDRVKFEVEEVAA